MLARLQAARREYPGQFWLMFWGMLISTTGSSMIWPFLLIYVSGKLDQPLATIASLLTLNSIMGLIFSFIAGPITDRFGRKWVMVIGLAYSTLHFQLLNQASSLPAFAILMALSGVFNPLYRIGADAMVADLIPAEKRADAYAILRMSNNLGVSIGPAVGGFIASVSYTTAFMIASAGMALYSILLAVRARETLPAEKPAALSRERYGGYGRILKDGTFMSFAFSWMLNMLSASILWILLSVYAKQNFNVQESQYGWIPTTNALMVVFLQVWVTGITKRGSPLKVMALGALFYAAGVGGVALGAGFWWFWFSMIVSTVGELIITPTSNTFVANLAPPDMRGRYMSIYGLGHAVAYGLGPLLGGLVNDNISPRATWVAGGMFGLLAAAGFLMMFRRYPRPAAAIAERANE